jgi:repressor of nif and glnA expression
MHELSESRIIAGREANTANFRPQYDGGGMGKEERMQLVIDLLAESNLALPPGVIFRNLKYKGATFERRTLMNYLQELHQEGLIEKVDPQALEKGRITTIEHSETGYYVLTEKTFDESS